MSWVPSYDTSFYFDPLSDPPSSETNLTTIPALRQAGGHAGVSRSRLSQSQPERAPHYALATEARMQQTSQVPSSGGTSFSLHFTKDRKGAHFGEPPRATKPKVDFSKTERPWEPKGGISPEQYTSRRMQYVVKKHKVSKLGAARRRSVPLLTPSFSPSLPSQPSPLAPPPPGHSQWGRPLTRVTMYQSLLPITLTGRPPLSTLLSTPKTVSHQSPVQVATGGPVNLAVNRHPLLDLPLRPAPAKTRVWTFSIVSLATPPVGLRPRLPRPCQTTVTLLLTLSSYRRTENGRGKRRG
jgi:hypothetical protein